MTNRPEYPNLEIVRLREWASCDWGGCSRSAALGLGPLSETSDRWPAIPFCPEHGAWILGQAVEDALYEARGCVHLKHLVCDRCSGAKLTALETIEADCGCVYDVQEQMTTTWCPEHGPYFGISEAVSSS